MMELRIEYPSFEEETNIADLTTRESVAEIRPVLSAEELMAFQGLVRRIPAPPSLVEAAVRLARSTRPTDADAPEFIRRMVAWGAGPRASQYLVLAAKARAALDGRPIPDLDDVRTVAPDVLRHRVVPGFEAEASGRTADDLIDELVQAILV